MGVEAQNTDSRAKTPQIPSKAVMSAEAAAYPKQLMPIIETKRTSGKKNMEKIHKGKKKKTYTSGCRIIKEKMQTDK